MTTDTYYVMKPMTHRRRKVVPGTALVLTDAQARPLCNGGFITPDQAAAECMAALLAENAALKACPIDAPATDTLTGLISTDLTTEAHDDDPDTH